MMIIFLSKPMIYYSIYAVEQYGKLCILGFPFTKQPTSQWQKLHKVEGPTTFFDESGCTCPCCRLSIETELL